jgi:hypothetical protein
MFRILNIFSRIFRGILKHLFVQNKKSKAIPKFYDALKVVT